MARHPLERRGRHDPGVLAVMREGLSDRAMAGYAHQDPALPIEDRQTSS